MVVSVILVLIVSLTVMGVVNTGAVVVVVGGSGGSCHRHLLVVVVSLTVVVVVVVVGVVNAGAVVGGGGGRAVDAGGWWSLSSMLVVVVVASVIQVMWPLIMCNLSHTTLPWVEEREREGRGEYVVHMYVQWDLENIWSASITSAIPACNIVTPLPTTTTTH